MGILDFLKGEKPKSVDDPIEGYKLMDLYKGINIQRNAVIPKGAEIGSRLVLIHNPANEYTNESITLLLVPQKKIFGYIEDNRALKHIVKSLKSNDKVEARISSFSKKKYEHTIKVKPITNKLKNGNEKKYRTLTWSYKNKAYSATIGRFAMAWKFGSIPDGYVIDHIKNDSLLDNYDNWQPLTIKDNNRKRFEDNPGYTCFNQFKNTRR